MYAICGYILLLCVSNVHSWLEECGGSKYPDAGAPQTGYIVGGWEARPYEFPWQISMHRLRDSGEFTHSCGGEIINQNWILTAAHCVDDSEPDTLKIHIGAHNLTNPDDEILDIYDVAEIFFHEDYNPATTENDIALLRLTEEIAFSENVQPVCRPDASVDYTGADCIVSGWGSLNFNPGNRTFPDTLQAVSVPITDQQVCVDRYAAAGSLITDDMICAGRFNETEHDACQGDSGGPLVFMNEAGRFEVVGIVSWGIGCANTFPGVYARVPYFLDWIDNILGSA